MSFKPYYPHKADLVELPEAASQTFVAGNLVYVDSSGHVAECGADPASIYGVAATPGHNGSAGVEKCQVWPITGTFFVAMSNTTTAQTHAGAAYGVVLSSSVWYVDIADESNKRFYIDFLHPGDAVGTSGGRYIGRFQDTADQMEVV